MWDTFLFSKVPSLLVKWWRLRHTGRFWGHTSQDSSEANHVNFLSFFQRCPFSSVFIVYREKLSQLLLQLPWTGKQTIRSYGPTPIQALSLTCFLPWFPETPCITFVCKSIFLHCPSGVWSKKARLKENISRVVFLGSVNRKFGRNFWQGQFRCNRHMGEDHWSEKRAKEAVPLCGGEAQLGRVMVSGRRGQRPTTGLRQRALDPASEKGLATFTEVVKERGG